MKKIALITTNKILAQSLDFAIKHIPSLEFELTLLLNPYQALVDAEILGIDVALIDMGLIDLLERDIREKAISLNFCKKLKKILPSCHVLLIVSQDDQANRLIADRAKKEKIVDDYMFYDTSLKYLLAKIAAFT